MSGAATALSGAGFIAATVQSIVAQNTRRMIWPVVDQSGNPVTDASGAAQTQSLNSYVTLLEEHRDELQITQHPVEQGAVISDHAYKLPAMLTVRIAWSAASANRFGNIPGIGAIPFSGIANDIMGGSSASYLKGLYSQLLQLQASRSLVTIYTGKRAYQNMLPESISVTTDEKTENALMMQIGFREIIIVNTQTVSLPINSSAQANPQATTPATKSGQQQLQPAQSYNGAIVAA